MLESLKPLYNRSSHLGEQLLNDGLISQEQLQNALARKEQTRKRLGETILQLGYVPARTLGKYLEASIRCPFFELSDYPIDLELTRLLPEPRARRLQAIPIKDRGHDILIAMSDPLNLGVLDEISALMGRVVTAVLVFEADLNEAINRIYKVDVQSDTEVLLGEAAEGQVFTEETNVDILVQSAEDAPVVKLVNTIIMGAITSSASDIHIEPQDGSVRVRYRIDGILADQNINIPSRLHAAVASRIKIMARCDISERRRPQDGRIPFKKDGRENDLRVSIMPTIYGEKVVMRILERNRTISLEQIGFFPEQMEVFDRFIRRPHGMILITGPTGSGKSTTLQAALTRINRPDINISTVEDPVEYRIPGINHTQVDTKIGVSFSSGLRTLVRQDPDVIMVGEIRDKDTAEIAIQAALTGHLVMSTLHTNDAPGSITRLINMGVEPFLVASALLGVAGQRLLRTVCQNCIEEVTATPTELDALGIPHTEEFSTLLARGKGCPKCGNRGMKGRTSVMEIMEVTEEIRELTLQRAPSSSIKEMAVSQGMKTMRESGTRKVLQRITTLDEVTRVLIMDE